MGNLRRPCANDAGKAPFLAAKAFFEFCVEPGGIGRYKSPYFTPCLWFREPDGSARCTIVSEALLSGALPAEAQKRTTSPTSLVRPVFIFFGLRMHSEATLRSVKMQVNDLRADCELATRFFNRRACRG